MTHCRSEENINLDDVIECQRSFLNLQYNLQVVQETLNLMIIHERDTFPYKTIKLKQGDHSFNLKKENTREEVLSARRDIHTQMTFLAKLMGDVQAQENQGNQKNIISLDCYKELIKKSSYVLIDLIHDVKNKIQELSTLHSNVNYQQKLEGKVTELNKIESELKEKLSNNADSRAYKI